MKSIFRQLAIALVSLTVLIVATLFFTSQVLSKLDAGKIAPGVSVLEVPVGGMTPSLAQDLLQQKLKQKQKGYISFLSRLGWWRLPLDDYGIRYDLAATMKRLEKSGGYSGIDGILFPIMVRGGSLAVPPALRWETDTVGKLVESLQKHYNVPARDARVCFSHGEIQLIPHSTGLKVDKRESSAIITSALQQGKIHDIKVPLVETMPRVTSDMVVNIKRPLGMYLTPVSSSDANRIHNIRLAARTLDGRVVLPGEVFSLNKALGPRTRKTGYRQAPTIINGQLANDWGGGVCQLATTLYNACRSANLEIVEKTGHSKPLSYAPPGDDATLFYGRYDFKFKNNLSYPIAISSTVENGNLVVWILGSEHSGNNTVALEKEENLLAPDVRVIIDRTKPPGYRRVENQGSAGKLIKYYRVVRDKSDRIIERQLLAEQRQPGRATTVIEGPASNGGLNK